jgi:hypothetical protein
VSAGTLQDFFILSFAFSKEALSEVNILLSHHKLNVLFQKSDHSLDDEILESSSVLHGVVLSKESLSGLFLDLLDALVASLHLDQSRFS